MLGQDGIINGIGSEARMIKMAKKKDSEKLVAIQTAMLAGLHLDPKEAYALIKSGFFSDSNKPKEEHEKTLTSHNKPAKK